MEIIIEAGRAEKNYWKDIWRFRELFYILAWRDIKVRYKQTVIGVTWSFIRPLLTMLVFTIVFNKIANLESESNAPYAILVYAAMLPWQFFANSLSESSGSLLGNTNLITKVYFPRLIIPSSSIIVSLIDFLISFIVLILLFFYFQYIPPIQILFIPAFIFLAFLSAFGSGLILTALNVKYRDFRYVIPFIIQFGLYISPVGFSSKIIPENYQFIYSLNPMVGVIDGFRWCILGSELNVNSILLSIITSVILMICGLYYFRKMEKGFADII